jgi:prepilin-type N-terminal cleavage/methylation domain-containing protein
MNMTTSPSRVSLARRGFTLIEILVVVGIIVLLASILVPLVGRAMRQAKQTRTAADMAVIGTALEAFKADHGDYPRVELPNLGFALLGKNLYGPLGDGVAPTGGPDDLDPPAYVPTNTYRPGDVVQTDGTGGNVHFLCIGENTGVATSDTTKWIECDPNPAATPTAPPIQLTDGVDGAGLRLRDGGKKWGPYLQEGKFKFRGVAILDGNDNPILYFPARPGSTNVNVGTGYLRAVVANPTLTTNDDQAKYDVFDNWSQFVRSGETDERLAQWRIHAMLGDYEPDGHIDTSKREVAIPEHPFLLWAAGPDGVFGPTAITDGTGTGAGSNYEANRDAAGKCDDVTNYR